MTTPARDDNAELQPTRVGNPMLAQVRDFIDADEAPPALDPIGIARRALRGRERRVALMTLLVALLAAIMAYLAIKPSYQSSGMLRVLPREGKILYSDSDDSRLRLYDAFVTAEMQLLSSRPTLEAALQHLQLDHDDVDTLQAGLLVVADGAGSALRASLGVAAEEKPYGQHALVANVAFAHDHRGCAFERFTDQGPLALLPLLAAEGAPHRAALVWTLPQDEASGLCECGEPEFLAALQDRFGYRLGRLTQVGERFSYPLSLLQSEEQVRQGLVIMGNAAHALHPVAGQGFNLALRDVAALAETLACAFAEGCAPGELAVLQGYEQRQRADQARTIQFSDLLPQLFMRNDPVLGITRDMALSGLDVVAPLKRQFVRQAAGMAALGATGG